MASTGQTEHQSYRLIVLARHGAEVLLVRNGERFMLPSVEIPRWQRIAENLTAAFKTDWGAEVVCLFELPTESADHLGITRYHAAEHLHTCSNPKMPTRWIPVSVLYQESFTEKCDYTAIKQEAFIRITEHLNQQCLACQTHVADSTANIGACPAAMLFWCSWENGSERIEGRSVGLKQTWPSIWT